MDIAGISSMQNMKIKEISTGMRNHNMLSLLPSYHCLILHILAHPQFAKKKQDD